MKIGPMGRGEGVPQGQGEKKEIYQKPQRRPKDPVPRKGKLFQKKRGTLTTQKPTKKTFWSRKHPAKAGLTAAGENFTLIFEETKEKKKFFEKRTSPRTNYILAPDRKEGKGFPFCSEGTLGMTPKGAIWPEEKIRFGGQRQRLVCGGKPEREPP